MPVPIFKDVLYKLARERDYSNAPPLLKRTMSSILDQEVIVDLPKINLPTLIIWGSNDQVTPLKMGKQMNQLIPTSKLKIISGARHSPQFTHSAQTASLVDDFIQKLK